MRKFRHFSAVLSLFLLVPASIIWAQTITQQKGLTTLVFPTPQGSVKIYLPDDIRPGDVISGTVVAEPSGNNTRQTERNLAELVKYNLTIGGNKYQIPAKQETFKWVVPEDGQLNAPVELAQSNGSKSNQLTLPFTTSPVTEPRQEGCVIPSHALTAAPVQIKGSFDGDFSNTHCMVGGQPMEVIAESPRQCQVFYPATGQGSRLMQVSENGQEKCTRQISGVDLQVTTGKLNLRKGENTFIDVRVTGLGQLPDKATLTITNLTPGVVTMTNGNLQIIPIWPPADSAAGVFSVHCPAVSNSTGNFSVSINLDLPQPGQPISEESVCPPGYTKKSCGCGVNATISKSGNSFKVAAAPSCTGQYGVGINTFPVCFVKSTTYSWSVKSGKENVDLAGKADGESVIIRPKGSGGYVVCVTVTVTCIDGTVCTSTVCADQAGKTVTTPGDTETPPTTPETPVTTTSSRCKCSASCVITAGAMAGGGISYSGKVTAACTGTFGSGNTRSVCAVGPITYNWKIGDSGKEFAAIDGKNDGENVKVKLKKEGPYNIYLSGTVTCNDGTVCEYSCNVEVPYIPTTDEKYCQPDIKDLGDPAMDGGLKSKHIGIANTASLFRDEFIALEAEGADVDKVKIICEPKPPCTDTRSEKTIPVQGRVKLEWVIEGEGKGSFVKLGCLPDDLTAEGEHVIFKPPFVPVPKAADTTVITTIKLSIIDDGSPVADPTKVKTITIRTKRTKNTPDKYNVEVISADKYSLPALPAGTAINGTCSISGPKWEQLNDLAQPTIQLPPVPDNNKMVLGQWIVLTADDQRDVDILKFQCTSASQCNTGPGERGYPDLLLWDWTYTGGGKIILNPKGRSIIYEAPLDMPKGKEVIEVKIKVTVRNPGGPRKDADKPPGEITLYIYQPGIRLSHPELTWLPEEDNSLTLQSELMYKDGGWKPALAHMCRIQYFELVNVSNEKGVCLNSPVLKEADQCRDLRLKNEDGHEAWDDVKTSGSRCDTKELYQQARTKRPERTYAVTIHAKDFGAYGFLRSFGNVNKKTSQDGKPVYVSIPVKITDVTHPNGRLKKTEYPDNRVTIPHDIDENRIADGGWTAMGGVLVPDPANNNEDEDDKPAGDGFNGDGLSTYEEYRGFKVMDGDAIAHARSSYFKKDIFIRNESGLDLGTYIGVSGLQVHEINEKQYVDDKIRVVNANFNPSTHIVDQKGLRLIDKGNHSSLLGIAVMTTNQPAIPNQGIEVRIYSGKIAEVCKKKDMMDKLAVKIAAVAAHELLHANNVCHHGEQNPEAENSFNLRQGLRSGNVSCVMRYDNVGTPIRGHDPEAIGSDLCNSAAGTGYNANGNTFGDAAAKRGNCREQIRISGRGTPPKSCGNR